MKVPVVVALADSDGFTNQTVTDKKLPTKVSDTAVSRDLPDLIATVVFDCWQVFGIWPGARSITTNGWLLV